MKLDADCFLLRASWETYLNEFSQALIIANNLKKTTTSFNNDISYQSSFLPSIKESFPKRDMPMLMNDDESSSGAEMMLHYSSLQTVSYRYLSDALRGPQRLLFSKKEEATQLTQPHCAGNTVCNDDTSYEKDEKNINDNNCPSSESLTELNGKERRRNSDQQLVNKSFKAVEEEEGGADLKMETEYLTRFEEKYAKVNQPCYELRLGELNRDIFL